MKISKVKVFISSISILFLLVNFAACEKSETKTKVDDSWITKGTIDMKALVTMDELWEKQKELEGKVVTLELGEASSSYNGNSKPIKGVLYYHTGMHFSPLKDDDWNNIESYLNHKNIKYNVNDTLFLGLYSTNIISKEVGEVELPEWINFKGEIEKFNGRKELYPFADAKRKVLTGVFIGTYKNYYELSLKDSAKIYMSGRYFEIFPLGIKYLKENKSAK